MVLKAYYLLGARLRRGGSAAAASPPAAGAHAPEASRRCPATPAVPRPGLQAQPESHQSAHLPAFSISLCSLS